MQCKELEAVLESEGLSPLPPEAREHLAGCSDCQHLLADLSAIVVAAKRIPAEATPPDRIWVSVRAQLEAEGIIRDAAPVPAVSAPWWHNFAEFFRPRVLASVGAALFLVVGTVYFVQHHNVANSPHTPSPVAAQTEQPVNAVTSEPAGLRPVLPTTGSTQPTESARVPARSRSRITVEGLRPSPSEEAYLGDSAAVLTQTEDALPRRELANNPAVDASLRQNLRTLNDFIAECESRLKQHPHDQLIREYLNMAYQQKAELLNAMLDSGRSEH
jgi:hypothetical protein